MLPLVWYNYTIKCPKTLTIMIVVREKLNLVIY